MLYGVIIMPKVNRPAAKIGLPERRNSALFDIWSIIHMTTGIGLGWLIDPFVALSIMILWEPLEVLVLSPLLRKRGIIFGYETIRNSLSDIFFDFVGVALGAWVLAKLVSPPFHLF